MDQPWQIEMFGWLRVAQPDRVISRFRTRKAEALLAYLAYHPHRSHPREQLIELLWPDCEPAAGHRNLRVELASLRRQLEPPSVPPGAVLVADRVTLRLNPDACVTDVTRFEAALQAAERAASPAARAEHLIAAAELYRGELLPGLFENWVLPERQRLAEAFLQALHALVALLDQLGDRPRALQWARRAVAADPLDEESHHLLIRLLVAAGQIEAARSQFEQGQQLLEEELGAGLSSEIHALIRDLASGKDRPPPLHPRKQQDHPGGATPGQEPPTAADSEVSSAFAATARPAGNLPLRFTRFFGREAEIAALVEVLSGVQHGGTETRRRDEAESHRDAQDQRDAEEPHSNPHPVHPVHPRELSAVLPSLPGEIHRPTAAAPRLVTMTGPGGTGKTRLALETAARLRDTYPGGIWFVSLVDLTDPVLIPDQILLALRLPRRPESEALEQAVAFLSGPPALLLLDNFEHLVEGGAEIVGNLLQQVERLKVLVTSRQCLGLESECEFPVAPLPVPVETGKLRVASPAKARHSDLSTLNPQLSTLMKCASIALFLDRAQAARPDFQMTAHNAAAIAELCHHLEGLPLAIELAAARARVLTPQQMLARLDQRFELLTGRRRSADPRHRSLRATLDWSYQSLSPELQRFFAQLSVFRGGWTVGAAEAICVGSGADEEPSAIQNPKSKIQNTLSCLEQLRECSLLQTTETADEMRFHLLETLREYGAEQLVEEGRSALAHRHARFFVALAETAEPELTGADQDLWLDRLEREHDNLRVALAWSVESGQPQIGLRLGGALDGFWSARGYRKEGRGQFQRLLEQPGAEACTAARAKVLASAGRCAWSQQDLETARTLHEEGLAIRRHLEDRAGTADSLEGLAAVVHHQGNLPAARDLLEECLPIRRELGDQRGVASSLLSMGWLVLAQGEVATARTLAEECLTIWRELEDCRGVVGALDTVGCMTLFCGELDRARSLFEETLASARAVGDKVHIAWGLTHLGWVAERQEDYAAACKLYEQSLAVWRELGDNDGLGKALFDLGSAACLQADYTAARPFFTEALAIARKRCSDKDIVWALISLGEIASEVGDWEEAAAVLTESLKLFGQGERANKLAIPRCLHILARMARAQGNLARAARLLGTAGVLDAASGFSLWPAERRAIDADVSAARAQLDAAEFEAAWAAGQAMPLGEAIALALQEVTGG